MDIPALSMAMAQSNIMTQFNVAVLQNSLETAETVGSEITTLMGNTASVVPGLGENIDVSV